MRIRNLKSKLAGLVIGGWLWPAAAGWAQSVPVSVPAQPVVASVPALQLSPGARQVLQLYQARVSDDTIISFIRNSSANYHLDADEIIYLRQQGISSPVLVAMLSPAGGNQAIPMPATPAPVVVTAYPPAAPAPVVYTAPPVTVIQAAPDPVYYAAPYYNDPYCYGYYPSVGLYFGGVWGGGYYGGGGYHGGGYHGGGYPGGGYHGGGGGFHGGGGGGGHR
jgi:hypothetical protein